MTTIGLSMIVKNESHVIEDCLNSVKSLVDYVLIEDTGSDDNTPDIIRNWLAKNNIPGEVVFEPWRDFGYNRSHALTLMRAKSNIDYVFVIDADDKLIPSVNFDAQTIKNKLVHDHYQVTLIEGGIVYQRGQLFRNRLEFFYRGVLHEYLQGPDGVEGGHLDDFTISSTRNGARNKDPLKYQKDAAILEQALEQESDSHMQSRYTFYIANSYRDAGMSQQALEWYLKREHMGWWNEEIYISLLLSARIQDELGHDVKDIIDTCERAGRTVPTRLEALHHICRILRTRNMWAQGWELGKRALNMSKTAPQGLFVENWIFDIGMWDELSILAYWTGHFKESFDLCQHLLNHPLLPQDMIERVTGNLNAAIAQLGKTIPSNASDTSQSTSKPLKIAVYTIALNEEKHVDRWLNSARDADYLVVGDTGSKDNTVSLLVNGGATVHSISVVPWRFDTARNQVLDLVPEDTDICISLDMDEYLMPGWRDLVLQAWRPDTNRLFYQHRWDHAGHEAIDKSFRRGKVHSRHDYRWFRLVHEELKHVKGQEKGADISEVLIGELQDAVKDRGQYLPLMVRAHQEDPLDAQLAFWLGREQMYAGQTHEAIHTLKNYLSIPNWTWQEERSEAMRYLSRLQPNQEAMWLDQARQIAPHRREIWSALAEMYHHQGDWQSLVWACEQGLKLGTLTGSYLDDPTSWNFRLNDLAAVGYDRLNMHEPSVTHGQKALDAAPNDERLKHNLNWFTSQWDNYKKDLISKEGTRFQRNLSMRNQIQLSINATQPLIQLSESDETWTVGILSWPNHVHSAAMVEFGEAVVWGLMGLGLQVNTVNDVRLLTGNSILIGAHLLDAKDAARVPGATIVYNTEHITSDFFNSSSELYRPWYVELLRRNTVWDYSPQNGLALENLLGKTVKYVPLGYCPQHTRVIHQPHDIDVLFYGSIKDRRNRVLDQIAQRGLVVNNSFGVYGVERDRLVARSRVVINMHANLPGHLEISRLSYLLSNSKAVVCEINPGEYIDPDLRESVVCAPYEKLVDACVDLVSDAQRRTQLQQRAFEQFSQRSQIEILRKVLNK